jgi:hypothetical protein
MNFANGQVWRPKGVYIYRERDIGNKQPAPFGWWLMAGAGLF